jgi:hypothetical protein
LLFLATTNQRGDGKDEQGKCGVHNFLSMTLL